MNPFTWGTYEWETFSIVFVLFCLLLAPWTLMNVWWSAGVQRWKQGTIMKNKHVCFVVAKPGDESQ